MTWLNKVEGMIARGDLIAASRLLDAHRVMESTRPKELVIGSRLWCLRGRLDEARDLLDRALDADAANVDALIERARLAIRLGDDPGANGWFQRAWDEGARGDDWMVDWIDVLLRLGRHEEARNIAMVRCERAPEEAHTWFRLGLAHQQDRHHLQALDAYRHAMRLDPRLPMLRNNMGAAHLELRQYDEAKALLEATLAEEPDHALAWTNLATTLLRMGETGDSLVAAERACALAPNYVNALQTYSYVLREWQEFPAALAVAERALALDPQNASLLWTVAMLQLMLGDYGRGWQSHEARWHGSPELRDVVPNIPAPRWNGEPLAGRTLFVWGEQGHGDVLQFARFVPAIAARVEQEGGTLVYCCFDSLHTLLMRSLGDRVPTIIAHDQRPLPPYDFHLPLASLPLMLGTGLADLPGAVPYLKADPAQTQAWDARLRRGRQLRVGLVWTGSHDHQRNAMRSVDPLACAQAFAAIEDVTFVNLQLDAAADVQRMHDAGLALVDHTAELGSFDETAALVASLDLVITVCTSVAHLAGGLGVPVWVLLDVNPHWPWMSGRTDSPWYPSARLYRQPAYGAWSPVFDALARDLATLAHEHREHAATAGRTAA
ncbi:tetratricopeptide repeat protein [Paraburkholderia sp. SUR17]|uniref:tetratricopeptide repeat protein n=1 Tax=Paraburkholderia sp. SUR17 TaxID=3034358 RepID=UPI00240813E0|nr:tetratricopeptide repeat protein [Paraburkholderia sp. SUR17]WEY42700.1 tetratricopeptide repeat protein [Paraburkholderia sp. SUR17]